MSVVPEDFLVLAKQTDLSVTKEIEVRNAISRAYYAAYHRALETFPADKEFGRNSGYGVHESYIEQLMQCAPGTVERTTAVKLKTMKGRRTIADYRLADEVKAYTAAQQNAAADDIFSTLDLVGCSPESATPDSSQGPPDSTSTAFPCSNGQPERRPTLRRLK